MHCARISVSRQSGNLAGEKVNCARLLEWLLEWLLESICATKISNSISNTFNVRSFVGDAF